MYAASKKALDTKRVTIARPRTAKKSFTQMKEPTVMKAKKRNIQCLYSPKSASPSWRIFQRKRTAANPKKRYAKFLERKKCFKKASQKPPRHKSIVPVAKRITDIRIVAKKRLICGELSFVLAFE